MIKKTDLVFISGPMTGYPNYNRERFYQLEERIRNDFGCFVINSADIPDGYTYDEYMLVNEELVAISDIIVQMDNWNESFGATREFIWGIKLRKPIMRESQLPMEKEMTDLYYKAMENKA